MNHRQRSVVCKVCIAVVNVTFVRFECSVNVCPDHIFWAAEALATKLSNKYDGVRIITRHAKRLECCLQSQGSNPQDRCFVCLFLIFWTTEVYSAKLGMLLYYQLKINCGKIGLLSSRSRSHFTITGFDNRFVLCLNIITPNLVCWCINTRQTDLGEFGLLSTRLKSQGLNPQECVTITYHLNCCTFL